MELSKRTVIFIVKSGMVNADERQSFRSADQTANPYEALLGLQAQVMFSHSSGCIFL